MLRLLTAPSSSTDWPMVPGNRDFPLLSPVLASHWSAPRIPASDWLEGLQTSLSSEDQVDNSDSKVDTKLSLSLITLLKLKKH